MSEQKPDALAQLSPPAQKLKNLQDALIRARTTLSAVASSKVKPETLIKIGVAAAQRSPALLDCTPSSIVRAILQGAELGITPGSALNHAYLVPFKNTTTGNMEAQLIISAQGLCELMYRSGLVLSITSEVVYKGDEFEYELGLEPILRHVPKDETINPDDITHAYMVVILQDGAKVFRVMTRKAIDRIRSISKMSGSGPWRDHYAEMARKTVIKNGSKYVPKSIEVARAMALDASQESGDVTLMEFDSPEALGFDGEEPAMTQGTMKKLESRIGVDPQTAESAEEYIRSLELSAAQKKDLSARNVSASKMIEARDAGICEFSDLIQYLSDHPGLDI